MDDSWSEYSKLVLKELETREAETKDIYEKLNKLNIDMAVLQVKAGVLGVVAGAITSLIPTLISMLK